MKRGRKQSRQLQSRVSKERRPSADQARRPAIMGIGVGGIALIVGGAFAIWRLLHRGQPKRSTWYTGEYCSGRSSLPALPRGPALAELSQ